MSQLHEVVQWVGPDAAQPLTPRSDHLRSPTAQSAHRGAPGAPSRPKRLVTAREDRGEDGLPTVEAAQVVEVVDLSVGDVPSSRSSGAGPGWSCRAGSALARHGGYPESPALHFGDLHPRIGTYTRGSAMFRPRGGLLKP